MEVLITNREHWKDPIKTECHKGAVRENKMHTIALGILLLMLKVLKIIPKDSAIKKFVKKMTINEHRALVVSYCLFHSSERSHGGV